MAALKNEYIDDHIMEIQKKRHHYIPQFLSKRFCFEDSSFFLYDSQKSSILKTSPKNAFIIKNYHSVLTDEGNWEHNKVEDMFMQFESKASKVISKIIGESSISLDDEDRDWLSSFWALLYLRTPVARGYVESLLLDTVRNTTRHLDKIGKLPPMPDGPKEDSENLSDLLDNRNIDFEISLPQVTLGTMEALQPIQKRLTNMNWCLLSSECSDYFLLSDNPVAIINPYIDENNGYNFEHPCVEVSFPIDKNHCLLASWKKMPLKKRASSKIVRNINVRSSFVGKRFFAHPLESKKISNLINRYRHIMLKAKTETMPTADGGYIQYFTNNIVTNREYRDIYLSIRPIFNTNDS